MIRRNGTTVLSVPSRNSYGAGRGARGRSRVRARWHFLWSAMMFLNVPGPPGARGKEEDVRNEAICGTNASWQTRGETSWMPNDSLTVNDAVVLDARDSSITGNAASQADPNRLYGPRIGSVQSQPGASDTCQIQGDSPEETPSAADDSSEPVKPNGKRKGGGSSGSNYSEKSKHRHPVEGEWIVRFEEYLFQREHLNALVAELGDEREAGRWQWVERANPAAAFPTDFGLLRIPDVAIADLKLKLTQLPFVKDVSPQMKFTRALMYSATEDEGQGAENTDTRQNSRTKRGKNAPEGCGASGAEGKDSCKYDDRAPVEKCPGRFQTRMSWGEEEEGEGGGVGTGAGHVLGNVSLAESERRRLLQVTKSQITSLFEAEKLWAKGFSGAKVRMAVFDTGVRSDHPHFRNIEERTNWTDEDTLNDSLGHGTFVAGVISSQDAQCRGFAPDVEIYAFRVFTNAQVSYTSWFLDAFNYAIATEMNVLNLSIGGPDYMDRPFVEKVWEMSGNNIIMVSAIGNDGPLYGTLNNPADQSDVIGVGGIDYTDDIAVFSSRGMTTWELPHGYGRMKPDIVAYGREVMGSRISQGCKSLSGTSVASPVVAGAVCLLASVVPLSIRWSLLNPASMKQALVEGATRLEGPNMFEQGVGRLNL